MKEIIPVLSLLLQDLPHDVSARVKKYLCMFLLMAGWIHSVSRAAQPVFTPLPPYGARGVYALAVSGNQLYVAFDNFPETAPTDTHLAQWDGNAWSSLGAPL